MRIALITDGISPYVIGGMQKHSFYLAKYFAKHKVQVDLVHYNQSDLDIRQLNYFTEEEKLYIHSIVIEFPHTARFPGHYIYASYKYAELAYEAIKTNLGVYDFIYTKGFAGWKLIQEKHKGTINCCNIGVKFHGYEMFQVAPDLKSKIQQYLLRPFVKTLSRQADVVFSYGGKITDIIRALDIPDKRIIEIPSGVEKELISTSIATHQQPVRKFVFLGRYERRKGILELNEALKVLISEQLHFKFEFIGPIPEEKKIVHPDITYYGEIRDAQQIRLLLQQSDVLVCPSWSEGFPNVILEGMAAGLAIIATDVGAVSAMVSTQNGWLIEPANHALLKTTLKDAVHLDEAGLTKKKEHSLELVNTRFNWDSIYEQLSRSIFREA